jgi:hypothetical protein
MAQQVALLPAITLLSQIFFATFFGFLGLFLSLPLTVVAQIWFKEVIVKDILDNWDYSFAGHGGGQSKEYQSLAKKAEGESMAKLEARLEEE